jgi:hypothetical protein
MGVKRKRITGGYQDIQSAVLLNDIKRHYESMFQRLVHRWQSIAASLYSMSSDDATYQTLRTQYRLIRASMDWFTEHIADLQRLIQLH